MSPNKMTKIFLLLRISFLFIPKFYMNVQLPPLSWPAVGVFCTCLFVAPGSLSINITAILTTIKQAYKLYWSCMQFRPVCKYLATHVN